jgi:DNA invertase Pin-like site-specific DNA recombinase
MAEVNNGGWGVELGDARSCDAPADGGGTLEGVTTGAPAPAQPENDAPITDLVPAVAYLRVSTVEQAERGLGLATQRDAIVKWATDHGRVIIGWHRDEGKSGTIDLDHRLALASAVDQALLERCELVVYRLDRLSRSLIIQEQALEDLTKKGATLRCCDETEDRLLVDPSQVDDADAHTRILLRQVIGAVGMWERSMISMRLRQGRRKADAEGFYTGGYAPYGWVKPPAGRYREKRRWVPDPGPRWAIAGWIMDARGQGCGYRMIANELNARGIERPKLGSSSFESIWHPSAVRSVERGVLRMLERGYATPGWRPFDSAEPSWGLPSGNGDSIGTPAAL